MDLYEKAAEFIELSKKKKRIQDELDVMTAKVEALEKELYRDFIRKDRRAKIGGICLKAGPENHGRRERRQNDTRAARKGV